MYFSIGPTHQLPLSAISEPHVVAAKCDKGDTAADFFILMAKANTNVSGERATACEWPTALLASKSADQHVACARHGFHYVTWETVATDRRGHGPDDRYYGLFTSEVGVCDDCC